MRLSILICTLRSRHQLLQALMENLDKQIQSCNAMDQVEVLIFEDNKEHSVGAKRTKLVNDARGAFVVFIDDDDDIADDYVFQILDSINRKPDIDCIGFRGILSVNGSGARQVIYSLQNTSQVEVAGTYYRLPSHLTPIKKSCLVGMSFSNKNYGEDSDFSSTLLRERRLKKEFFIDKVLYHYRYDASSSETSGGKNLPAIQGVDPTRFEIVILSNQPDNLRGCLDSILKNEPSLDRNRIIVVDDGSKEYCEKEYPGIRWLSGEKPFVFARNANIGIRHSPGGVILLNDDARLETKFGFHSLVYMACERTDFGIVSAAINGFVGNGNQKVFSKNPMTRMERRTLAFISVYIPKDVLSRVGLLDERFVAYGFDDNDYHLRVQKANFGTAIYDGCVVEHNSKENKSTYRVKPEIQMLLAQNKKIFDEKWGVQK